MLMFEGCGSCCFVLCKGNNVEHYLASLAILNPAFSVWVDCMPNFMELFVLGNLDYVLLWFSIYVTIYRYVLCNFLIAVKMREVFQLKGSSSWL